MRGPPARVHPARRQSSVVTLLLSSPQVVHAFLSARLFTVVWLCVVGSQFMLGMSRLVVAITHLRLADPVAYASFTLVQVPRDVVWATGWSMVCVSSLHFLSLGLIIRNSIRSKRLTFFHHRPRIESPAVSAPTSTCHALLQLVSMPLQTVAVVIDRVFGVGGLVGISGPFFFHFFNLLEALEVVSQSFQAYQLSRYVYAPVLNAFIVAIIFTSSIAHPVVLFLTRRVKKRSMQRLAVVAIDLVLDLIYAEAIPGLVLLSTLREYDFKLRAFPPSVSFNDLWTNNAVAQARFAMVTSYLDLATTLVPHLNFILGIQTFKTLLHHRADVHRIADTAFAPSPRKAKTTQPEPRLQPQVQSHWWSTVFHMSLFASGVAVIGLHVDAQYHQKAPILGCKMPLSPWRLGSSGTASCGVLYLNCHRESIQGKATEIEAVLRGVDLSLLSSLILAHCPALEMPLIFTRISRLTGLEIFNSTLVDWNASVAVTHATLPLLHHVFLVDTNMTRLPDAIVHDQLPRSLIYLIIHGSNLTHLPSTVGNTWASHHWRGLDFERFNLQELPPSFGRVNVLALTLQSLKISSIPNDRVPWGGHLEKLRISGSAFQELPADLDEAARSLLSTLVLENTNVSTLPSWAMAWLQARGGESRRISFFGSPVCAQLEYTTYTSFCEQDVEYDLDVFAYDIVAAQRPV